MAKKAIIQTGSKQYVVEVGQTIAVELIKDAGKQVSLTPLLVIDGDATTVGSPDVAKVTVKADVVDADKQADKVTSIRYKAKKRVHTVRGHRQHQTLLKIASIA